MKKSKRGITLVELIICCGIMVMVAGACSAVLISGQRVFNSGSSSAAAQLDTDVIQSYFVQMIPRAPHIKQTDNVAAVETDANALFFKDGTFIIRSNSQNVSIRSVTEIEYSLISAGTADSLTSRAQLCYTIYLNDGSSFDSGFILSNLKYTTFKEISGKLSEKPLSFAAPISNS